MRMISQSCIEDDFEGWEGETIFKLDNGEVWQQSSYSYHYHYAYRPKVIIYQDSYGYKMKVDGIEEAISVTPLTSSSTVSDAYIESAIDGEFKGWSGKTIFPLKNGQVWQQTQYSYHYHYAYCPKVSIHNTSSGYEMKVHGVTNSIKVKKIG